MQSSILATASEVKFRAHLKMNKLLNWEIRKAMNFIILCRSIAAVNITYMNTH